MEKSVTVLRTSGVDPHQRIQVVEFQECSAYARLDVMVMCLYIDVVTYYVYSHVHNGLKLSVENYCTWLYIKNNV